jgi:hypothetical protein
MLGAALGIACWLGLAGCQGQAVPDEPTASEQEVRRAQATEEQDVNVEGLKFEAIVVRKWTLAMVSGTARDGKVGKGTGSDGTARKPVPVALGLRITNLTGKDLVFSNPWYVLVVLRAADGRELRPAIFVNLTFQRRDPVRIKAGRAATLSFPATLEWHGAPHGRATLLQMGDASCYFEGLGPGTYQARLHYQSTEKGPEGWRGKVTTKPVKVKLVKG